MQQTQREGRVGIARPQALHISDGARRHYGGNQIWYKSFWQRQAGCGPTVAATLCAYLAKTRPACAPLCAYESASKAGFLHLMQDLWEYVTPDMGGSTVEIFTSGLQRYADSKGIALACEVLDIPKQKQSRPPREEVAALFRKAFEADLPIAFQNYSNGALQNLDAWHWVTLIAFDPDTLMAEMYDQSRCDEINIPLYLETASNAGKFVIAWPTSDTGAAHAAY